MPDGSTTALTPGMKVPQGATIKTGADGDVYIESHAGYITSIKKDSEVAVAELSVTTEGGKVKEEKTLLDLKSGNLVAKLDPTKKAVNNYQVRTPKGVAAARGTVFTVQYKGGNYSIAVVNGVVTVLPPTNLGVSILRSDGTNNAGVQVSAGQATFADSKGSVGSPGLFQDFANGSDQTGNNFRELLAVAVATVAVAAQNNIGGTTPAEAAQVAQAIFAAAPGTAEQAGALIAQSTKGQDNSAVVAAITAVTPPAAQAAFTSGTSTGTFTPNTQTTTTNPSSNNNNGANQSTAPQPIDPSTVSRSN
jgi:hypothetical protein